MEEPMDASAVPLCCPLDAGPLREDGVTLRCDAGHTFDRSAKGYVNLLVVQHKRSRDPGDSKAMVAARHALFDSGVYAPIADAMTEVALPLCRTSRPVVFDAGCGEGYFAAQLADALRADQRSADIIGVDISKWAIAAAARRAIAARWVVGSVRQTLLPPNSADLILCTFGFPDYARFAEAVAPGGHVLLVDPDEDHLLELRERVYPEVRRKGPPSLAQAIACGWSLAGERSVRCGVPLSAEQLGQVLQMTPHLFRATHEGKQQLSAERSLTVTLHVRLRWLARLGGTRAE